MANKSMKWYVEHNDFEGAKERLENTNGTWKNRWFEICKTIFESCKELAKKYILDPYEKTIKEISKVAFKRRSKYNDMIYLADGCHSLLDEAAEKCYLFEFFDYQDNLICSKVGTTTRTVIQRLKEELKSKTYSEMGAVKAVIHRVYDCGEMPAEGLESYFRAMYIKKYPQSFKKNDRFIKEKFDFAEADKIACSYLGA